MNRFKRMLVLVFLALVVVSSLPPHLRADDPNRAALVVRFDDASVAKQCIEFSEPEITGYELLQRSDQSIQTEVQGMGLAVCGIGGVGCPASDCFCECKGGGDCLYWSFWQRPEGSDWSYAQQGASAVTVTDGMIQGWSWGPGSVTNAIAPPDLTFDDVCQSAEPTATPTAEPTATDTPTSEPVLLTPLVTSTRSATAVPPTATSTRTPQATSTPTRTPVPTSAVATATRSVTVTPELTATSAVTETPTASFNEPNGVPIATATPVATATIQIEVLPSATSAELVPTTAAPTLESGAPPPSGATPTLPSAVAGPIPTLSPQSVAVIGSDVESTSALATPILAEGSISAETPDEVNWLPYLIFLLLAAALVALVLAARQETR